MVSVNDSASPAPIATSHVERALRYVAALAGSGESLTVDEVDTYATREPPKGAAKTNALSAVFAGFSAGTRTSTPAEPVVAYCQAVKWLDVSGRQVLMTPRGYAVLRALTQQEDENTQGGQPVVVVLTPNDPWNGYKMAKPMRDAGEGMIVDPYFPPDLLPWLAEETHISRVLLKKDKAAGIAEALAAIGTAGRELEVRTAASGIHDRAIVHFDQQITVLGVSTNTSGKSLSVMIDLPAAAAAEYLRELENLWESAKPVTPKRMRAVGT